MSIDLSTERNYIDASQKKPQIFTFQSGELLLLVVDFRKCFPADIWNRLTFVEVTAAITGTGFLTTTEWLDGLPHQILRVSGRAFNMTVEQKIKVSVIGEWDDTLHGTTIAEVDFYAKLISP